MNLPSLYKVASRPLLLVLKKRKMQVDLKLNKAIRYLNWSISPHEVIYGSLILALLLGCSIAMALYMLLRSLMLSLCIGMIITHISYKFLYEEPLRRAEALSMARLKMLAPLVETLIVKGKVDALQLLMDIGIPPTDLISIRLGCSPERILLRLSEMELNPIIARIERTLAKLFSRGDFAQHEAKFLYLEALRSLSNILRQNIERVDVLLTMMISLTFFIPLLIALLSIFFGMNELLLAVAIIFYATLLNFISRSISRRFRI
ncbi:MAG: hypothetical protein DRJ66_03360 [Thermoprotei archaeon]|nr:MAG: hypothetical protein DRJ66_03360 [Thermoprotei archaeon]